MHVALFGMVYACSPVWNGLVVHCRVTVDLHMHLQPDHQLGTVDLHMVQLPEYQLGTVELHMQFRWEIQKLVNITPTGKNASTGFHAHV